jgi:hypothetical protein
LIADNFDDVASGALTVRPPPFPAKLDVGYVDGEYRLKPTGDLNASGWVSESLTLAQRYANTATTVDVRIVGDPKGVSFGIVCRQNSADMFEGYALSVTPSDGTFSVVRHVSWGRGITGGSEFPTRQESAAIRRGNETNRIGLISAIINGADVFTVRDSVHTTGGLMLQVTIRSLPASEIRLDNLEVIRR